MSDSGDDTDKATSSNSGKPNSSSNRPNYDIDADNPDNDLPIFNIRGSKVFPDAVDSNNGTNGQENVAPGEAASDSSNSNNNRHAVEAEPISDDEFDRYMADKAKREAAARKAANVIDHDPVTGRHLVKQDQDQNRNTQGPTTPTTASEGDRGPGTDGQAQGGSQQSRAPRSLPTTIAGPLRQIRYSLIRDRVSLMGELSKTIPLNEYGLPLFVYRPDLLNYADFQEIPSPQKAQELTQQLSAAICNISYVHGFPTIESGMPLWTQLPFEGLEAFSAFTAYLEIVGVRSLHELLAWDARELQEWAILYEWVPRAKAFDLFRAAHHDRQRMFRIMNAENNHYELADNLLKKVEKRIKDFSDDDFADMDPLTAANIIEKLTRVQRVSLGLQATGGDPQQKDGGVPAHRRLRTTEGVMRQVADISQVELQRHNESDVDLLRDAPDAVDLAQQLILQINQTKNSDDDNNSNGNGDNK